VGESPRLAGNTNWVHSSGTVSALIEGDGLADIDLHSIKLIGTDPGAAPLPDQRVPGHLKSVG
jgi:hypothetical protein